MWRWSSLLKLRNQCFYLRLFWHILTVIQSYISRSKSWVSWHIRSDIHIYRTCERPSSLCIKCEQFTRSVRLKTFIKVGRKYMSDRSRAVVVDGESSPNIDVESEVPQGSVLGSSFFLFYINDIQDWIKSTVRLIADGTRAYLTISSEKDTMYTDLQKYLDSLRNQLEHGLPSWQMQCLDTVQNAKYIGCTFTPNLRWNEHINTI